MTLCCSWWLKPAAAFRDGIIDETSHAITADNHGAYAIVLNGAQEQGLCPDGQFKFHAALDDPGVLKMTKTMSSDTDPVVRLLRSWKLRSKLAPKAGLRYDGLYVLSTRTFIYIGKLTKTNYSYRIISYGVKLLPPTSWHFNFTLARIAEQPPIEKALHFPTSDQLDDWRDYQ